MMKRSIRWYIAWSVMIASMSMLLFMVTAGPAMAWTQENNQYNDTGSGSGWCSGQDGKDSSHPCLYWQEPHYTSVHLTFEMDASLDSSASHGYDFFTAINLVFGAYEAIPAWNPYMGQCFSFCSGIAGEYYMTILPCGVYGNTTLSWNQTENGYNPQRGGNEYYAFINYIDTGFNSTVYWNNSFNWTQPDCNHNNGDGRATAAHETGHVIGLGHTGDIPAVMNPDDVVGGNYWQPTSNSDIPAVEAIYPGNQQSN